MFQDIQVMVFIGFGFLLAFMKFFCLTGVFMNYFLACLAFEWAILINGWFNWETQPNATETTTENCGWGLVGDHCTRLDVKSMTNSLFASATVLISMAALLGKITPTQMTINVVFEIVLYGVNRWIIVDILDISDAGHAMTVHAFGAFWGLAASIFLWPKNKKLVDAPGAKEAYANELFCFIGTVFMFAYWPSWNAFLETGMERHRAVLNTILSIVASCLASYAVSAALDKKGRFTVQHLQNSTLVGGVAIGSIASGVVHPFGALIIGTFAGLLSVLGYQYLTPKLNKMGVHDSAGVNNLHGLPGIYASVVSAIVAGATTIYRSGYEHSKYSVFPAMAPEELREDEASKFFSDPDFSSGSYPEADRGQTKQGGLQFVGILITMAISIAGGVLTGAILRFMPLLDQPDVEHLAEDSEFFYPHWEELAGEDAPLHSKNSMADMRLHDDGGDDDDDYDDDKTSKKSDKEEETAA